MIRDRIKKMPAILITILLGLCTLWAAAALYFDVRVASLRVRSAIAYLLAVAASYFVLHPFWPRALGYFVLFATVLVWWLSIKPSNDRIWQADVAQTAWAEVNGDLATIHNYRDCDYRAEFDYTCGWSDKTVKLSDIRGIDVFVVYWGSDWIAHPITSFQIGDHDHVAFSIETRKVAGRALFRGSRILPQLRTDLHSSAGERSGAPAYKYSERCARTGRRRLYLPHRRRPRLVAPTVSGVPPPLERIAPTR